MNQDTIADLHAMFAAQAERIAIGRVALEQAERRYRAKMVMRRVALKVVSVMEVAS